MAPGRVVSCVARVPSDGASDPTSDDFVALVVVGGQSPMFTFRDREELKRALRAYVGAGSLRAELAPST